LLPTFKQPEREEGPKPEDYDKIGPVQRRVRCAGNLIWRRYLLGSAVWLLFPVMVIPPGPAARYSLPVKRW
jgi:hypothetical protein